MVIASGPLATLSIASGPALRAQMAGTLPGITTSFEMVAAVPVAPDVVGVFGGTLPLPSLAIASQVKTAAVFDATLPFPLAAITGTVAATCVLTVTLPLPTMSVAGSAITTILGTVDGLLPLPRFKAFSFVGLSVEQEIVLQKIRIQNALIAAFMGGTFPPVVYDPETGLVSADETTSVAPAQVLINETQSFFASAERKRDRWRMERSEWTWQAIVTFSQEVSLEIFEQDITFTNPLKILSQGLLRPVLLELTQTDYSHPPQQQPSSGTQAVFTFGATLLPL